MMLTQSCFIPLNFDETETDLWQALQQIEPEKRSAFIKATLRQVLLNGDRAAVQSEVQVETSDNLPMEINHSEHPVDEPDGLLDKVGGQEFDLESLLVDTPIPSAGFEYMMKHIIGTEEDEVILKLFLNINTDKEG